MSINTDRSIPRERINESMDSDSDMLDKTCVELENVEKPMIQASKLFNVSSEQDKYDFLPEISVDDDDIDNNNSKSKSD